MQQGFKSVTFRLWKKDQVWEGAPGGRIPQTEIHCSAWKIGTVVIKSGCGATPYEALLAATKDGTPRDWKADYLATLGNAEPHPHEVYSRERGFDVPKMKVIGDGSYKPWGKL